MRIHSRLGLRTLPLQRLGPDEAVASILTTRHA
jgi:hypothetical protein